MDDLKTWRRSPTREKREGQVIGLGHNGRAFRHRITTGACPRGSDRPLPPGVGDLDPFGCRGRAKNYGVFAQRNPGAYKLRNDGGSQYRSADRRVRGLLFQDPPRITLNPPVAGPIGFCDGLFL